MSEAYQPPKLGADGILRFIDRDQFCTEFEENLSQGRLFFDVEGNYPTGITVHVELQIPGTTETIALVGKPVIKTNQQMGLELQNFTDKLKDRLKEISMGDKNNSSTGETLDSANNSGDPLKAATEQLVQQLSKTTQDAEPSNPDERNIVPSLAIAGMAMTSVSPPSEDWTSGTTPTKPHQSPLGQPGVSMAATPSHDNLKQRAEAAERQVSEFQYYVQQVLHQLSLMTRRAEMAEQYSQQVRQRAEYAEHLLAQVSQEQQGTTAQLKELKSKQRTTDWIQSKLAQTQTTEEFDAGYLTALEVMAKGQHEKAIEMLKALVKRSPRTMSYRTALHLAEGFHLQQQGLNPDLTQRFERAMLVEANEGKPRPPTPGQEE